MRTCIFLFSTERCLLKTKPQKAYAGYLRRTGRFRNILCVHVQNNLFLDVSGRANPWSYFVEIHSFWTFRIDRTFEATYFGEVIRFWAFRVKWTLETMYFVELIGFWAFRAERIPAATYAGELIRVSTFRVDRTPDATYVVDIIWFSKFRAWSERLKRRILET